MSITATWSEGVFKPTGEVKDAVPGKVYRVFSDEELLEPAFGFWNNEDDAAIYDQL